MPPPFARCVGGRCHHEGVDRVAFFRNLNQGQRGSPSTADLVAAFADARIPGAIPFQTNGTVFFTGGDPGDRVSDALVARTGYGDVMFAVPLARIIEVVAGFDAGPTADRRELSLFDPAGSIAEPAPIPSRRRCTVLAHGPGWAVTENDRNRESNGTPTVEELIGAPATSRGIPTLRRLVARFADAP